MKIGDWIDGYQVIERAPLSYIRGFRTREIEGHLVTGFWSDPWWVYNADRKQWAIVKTWKNNEYHYYWPEKGTIAARTEIVMELV